MLVVMKGLGVKKSQKIVKNVRIVDLSAVPPKFFLRPKVINSVRREVFQDLRSGRIKRVPAGVEAEFVKASVWDIIMSPLRRLL